MSKLMLTNLLSFILSGTFAFGMRAKMKIAGSSLVLVSLSIAGSADKVCSLCNAHPPEKKVKRAIIDKNS